MAFNLSVFHDFDLVDSDAHPDIHTLFGQMLFHQSAHLNVPQKRSRMLHHLYQSDIRPHSVVKSTQLDTDGSGADDQHGCRCFFQSQSFVRSDDVFPVHIEGGDTGGLGAGGDDNPVPGFHFHTSVFACTATFLGPIISA